MAGSYPEEIGAILHHLITVAREFQACQRWERPDAPGASGIPGLAERVASPEALGAFRTTEAGRYLLAVVQAYEDALNDAWLPFGIVRLPLDQARRFLGMLADELERHPLDEAWHRVASCHRSLMAR